MSCIRYLIYDLKAPFLIKFLKPKIFCGVIFKYFANDISTFKIIETNEPRSVEMALKMQDFGITRSMKKIKSRALFYLQIKHVFINKLISNKSEELVEFYEFSPPGASSIFRPTQDFLDTDKKR